MVFDYNERLHEVIIIMDLLEVYEDGIMNDQDSFNCKSLTSLDS